MWSSILVFNPRYVWGGGYKSRDYSLPWSVGALLIRLYVGIGWKKLLSNRSYKMDVLRIRIGIYYYYYYKGCDVILGAGGLCEISIKPRCPLGGGPNARRRVSFGRTRSYLLPWRLTRPAAAAADVTPLLHRTTTGATTAVAGTTAAVSIVSFMRARAYYNTRRLYTTLGRRHLCGPAPPRAKCIL